MPGRLCDSVNSAIPMKHLILGFFFSSQMVMLSITFSLCLPLKLHNHCVVLQSFIPHDMSEKVVCLFMMSFMIDSDVFGFIQDSFVILFV